MTKEQREIVERTTLEWADKGKIIEGGWQSYLAVGVPAAASDLQKAELRSAYYLGAQHLFASILGILEPGSEPTDKDLCRMALISEELERFTESLAGSPTESS